MSKGKTVFDLQTVSRGYLEQLFKLRDKRVAELEAENERLRERLRDQVCQTQNTAQQKHDAIAEVIVRKLGKPDYVDLQSHPIEQIVGTVLSKLLAESEAAICPECHEDRNRTPGM